MAMRKRSRQATKGLKPKKMITARQRKARRLNMAIARKARHGSRGAYTHPKTGKTTMLPKKEIARRKKIKRSMQDQWATAMYFDM